MCVGGGGSCCYCFFSSCQKITEEERTTTFWLGWARACATPQFSFPRAQLTHVENYIWRLSLVRCNAGILGSSHTVSQDNCCIKFSVFIFIIYCSRKLIIKNLVVVWTVFVCNINFKSIIIVEVLIFFSGPAHNQTLWLCPRWLCNVHHDHDFFSANLRRKKWINSLSSCTSAPHALQRFYVTQSSLIVSWRVTVTHFQQILLKYSHRKTCYNEKEKFFWNKMDRDSDILLYK